MSLLGTGSVHMSHRYAKKLAPTRAAAANATCQRCLQTGHWTYECKNPPSYASRPTRTQQLLDPKIRPRFMDPSELLPESRDKPDPAKERADAAKKKKKKEESSSSSSSDDSSASDSSSSEDSSSSSGSSSSSSSSSSGSGSDGSSSSSSDSSSSGGSGSSSDGSTSDDSSNSSDSSPSSSSDSEAPLPHKKKRRLPAEPASKIGTDLGPKALALPAADAPRGHHAAAEDRVRTAAGSAGADDGGRWGEGTGRWGEGSPKREGEDVGGRWGEQDAKRERERGRDRDDDRDTGMNRTKDRDRRYPKREDRSQREARDGSHRPKRDERDSGQDWGRTRDYGRRTPSLHEDHWRGRAEGGDAARAHNGRKRSRH